MNDSSNFGGTSGQEDFFMSNRARFPHPRFDSATDKQREVLAQILPPEKKALLQSDLSKFRASQLIKEHHQEWAKLPATYLQQQLLMQKYLWKPGMNRGEADELIRELKDPR